MRKGNWRLVVLTALNLPKSLAKMLWKLLCFWLEYTGIIFYEQFGPIYPKGGRDLQTAKRTFLIISLALTFMGCGQQEEEIPDAATMMRRNKVVRIGTDPVNLPFEFGSGTGVQGMDVDIGNEIGKDLGIEVRWVKSSGYDHMFELLQNGEVELLISSVAIDSRRSEDFLFSEPYFDSGDTIVYTLQGPELKSISDLSGKKIGVQAGRPAAAFIEAQETLNATVTKYPTFDDALGAANRTEIDAVVGDEPILTYSTFKSFGNLLTSGTVLNRYQYAVVVRKNEKELLAQINGTLKRLRDSGELATLRDKWFQDVMEQAADRRVKHEEEEALKKAPKSVACNIVKTGGTFNMDRLDGFELVLEGPNSSRFRSTPILTSGSRGNCRFSEPIPPGEYKLAMSIFKMTTTVPIPEVASKTVILDMTIARSGITITPR